MIVRLVVRAFLGRFVDLTNVRLSINLWGGEICHFPPAYLRMITLTCHFPGDVLLENVKLRTDVLTRFGVPLNIIQGTIRRLRIRLPWSRINDEATVLELEGVAMHMCKSLDLDAPRVQDQNATVKTKKPADGEPENPGMVKRFLNAIFRNLRADVKDFEIIYSCPSIRGQSDIAIGVKIPSISAETVDSSGRPNFIIAGYGT